MRLMTGAAALMVSVLLAGCGAAEDEPRAKKSAATSTATPARYVPCDVLTQAERDEVAGATIDYQGEQDFYFPEWSCSFGDAPSQTATTSIRYQAMRSPVWAAKVPDLIDTTPAVQEPRAFFAAVLQQAGVEESQLASIDPNGACDLWESFAEVAGDPADGGVSSSSMTEPEFNFQFASAQTCSEGVYASLTLRSRDADSSAARKRAVQAVKALHARAVDSLPD
ncbi:hypothetical protein [Aeromicrobium stalagmiti]|uniref:hypothetical protein n=1 Tax=Aeromicrobium stalagmiti TaxID=2738988 RepID=UPI00156995C2|nr:hypothetical protein [Aeromicrobium stalagmiti]NRQ48973.1 hypothetical protein [Aeromicrobium stalagmiti]